MWQMCGTAVMITNVICNQQHYTLGFNYHRVRPSITIAQCALQSVQGRGFILFSDSSQSAVVYSNILSTQYTLSQTERFYCLTSNLTEKLSRLRSFDRQQPRPQNLPFQSSFTQRTAQFTQGIAQCPQFAYRHHDGIISRQSNFTTSVSSNSISR